ncbi:hypothetical protein [Hathewaya limosa]|uniref:Repeat protein (TIGR01451 family)/fimbrial isopeptide formation D2 family protein n=1 Tax=Hathewaya limosa TaxID=1536 RepID=A0ABU0JQT9_HATLI|nr:hypothetical protein [Hathewaya limosa]MDQ0479463.1 putative repeat protein (TIGR01451 family)/fimbrial isopeptide formation D2 family protein [Hathewaya limosa]
MTVSSSDILVSINPNPIRGVIGKNVDLNLSFMNSSITDTVYNLHIELQLPDGVEYVSAQQQSNSNTISTNDYSQKVIWINMGNLEPKQSYNNTITIKGLYNFRNPAKSSEVVQFNNPIQGVTVNATVDTIAEGSSNPLNDRLQLTSNCSFIPVPYKISISSPKKVPKGAGTLSPNFQDPIWKYNYKITIDNNSVKDENCDIYFQLGNGIRYLTFISASGDDLNQFKAPIVMQPSNENNSTVLKWQNINLSKSSNNIVTIEAAIWNRSTENGVENSGTEIPQGEEIISIATLRGNDGSVEGFTTVIAEYFLIEKSVLSTSTDVGVKNKFTLSYKVNQYTSIGSNNLYQFQIIDNIKDGQQYNNDATETPIVIDVGSGVTRLTWDLSTVFPTDGGNTGVTKVIKYSTTTKSAYTRTSVSSGDMLSNTATMGAVINNSENSYIEDISSSNIYVGIPNLSKQILGYYYKDGTAKNFSVGAPGDLIEFNILYDANSINATQKNIFVRDFLPENMVNTPSGVIYGGSFSKPGLGSQSIDFNGLQWNLQTIPGNNNWNVKFRVPVSTSLNFIGQKYNWSNFIGVNSSRGSYMLQNAVNVKFGTPNVKISSSVTGPNVNNIKPNELYTYTINVSNLQNADNTVTDAFEMTLTGVIPQGLTYNSSSIVVKGNGTYQNPIISGQNLIMVINKLSPGETLTLTYDVTVDSNISIGSTFANEVTLTQPYSQLDKSYQYPGSPLTTSVELKSKSPVTMQVLSSPEATKVGEIVSYIIQITIAKGIIANNIRVIDTFPKTKQSFIQNSVLKDGVPITPEPTPIDGVLTFPTISSIDATQNEVNLIYSFSIRVTRGNLTDTFIDIQKNKCELLWNDSLDITNVISIVQENSLYVQVPLLKVEIYQKNLTTNSEYTTGYINFNSKDTLAYKIVIENVGKNTAYDVVLLDSVPNEFIIDQSTLNGTLGQGSIGGNNITWNIDSVQAGSLIFIDFNVTAGNNMPVEKLVKNNANIQFSSNNNGFGQIVGPLDVASVSTRINNITFAVNPSINTIKIGDTFKYTLNLNVGKGSSLNNVSIYDVLPTTQTFIGDVTKQINSNPPESITPQVVGQRINFPQPVIGPDNGINATTNSVSVQYVFTVQCNSGTQVPPYTQQQFNNAGIQWEDAIAGGGNKETTANTSVTVEGCQVNILIEQKNFTLVGESGSYTEKDILASIGDTVYYKVTLNIQGIVGANNLQIRDTLNNNMAFLKNISIPTGGVITSPNPGPGGTVQCEIPNMTLGSNVIYEFAVKVSETSPIGDSFTNVASLNYSIDHLGGKIFNVSSNTLNIKIKDLNVTQQMNITEANIGDEVQYTINIVIPKGTQVYDLSIIENLDSGQSYVASSWTSSLGGSSIPVITNSNTTIKYIEATNPIAATGSNDLIVSYTFRTKVIYANEFSPYTENQVSCCNVMWSNSLGGNKKGPVEVLEQIKVNRPMLFLQKFQKNTSKGETVYNTIPLNNVQTGDEIDYSLDIRNMGTGTAYNVISEDNLSSYLSFVDQSIPEITASGQKVTWTVAKIEAGKSANIYVKTNVTGAINASTNSINFFTSNYNGNNNVVLEPIKSKQVGFLYVAPNITTYVMGQNGEINAMVFSGSTIQYRVVIQVPKGSTVYNVQVNYNLNSNQTYVPNSLKNYGGVGVPSNTPNLVFPNEGTINASASDQTIIYTFKAVANGVSGVSQEKQESEATLSWQNNTGVAQPVERDKVSVYVTNIKLAINKSQSLDGINFVSNPIDLKINQNIYYKLEIQNTSTFAIYNINIQDSMPSGIVGQSFKEANLTGEFILENDNFVGNSSFKGTISVVQPSETVSIVYMSNLIGTCIVGNSMGSSASISYSTDISTLNVVYGSITSNQVSIMVSEASLQIDVTSSSNTINLGEEIEYLVKVNIPAGVSLYNIQLQDVLPGKQVYLGIAQLNGNSIVLNENGQNLISNKIEEINAINNPVILNYSLYARTIEPTYTQPFEEYMENNASLLWSTSKTSSTTLSISNKCGVTVKTANVTISQEQRNKTQEDVFGVAQINVKSGDLVEFKLQVQNTGAATAYNLNIQDTLNQYTAFTKTISSTVGAVSYNSSNRYVIWNIPLLAPDEIATAIIEVQMSSGMVSSGITTNMVNLRYNTNTVNPIVVGPILASSIRQKYVDIKVQISADNSSYILDSIISYNIIVQIPQGTTVYNLQLIDILPVEQSFIESTLNNNPVTPDQNGKLLSFPSINYEPNTLIKGRILDEFAQDENNYINYNYNIKAKVHISNIQNGTVDNQTNSANVTWSTDPLNKNIIGPISDTVTINTSENLIEVEKFQGIKGTNKFTKDNIEILNEEDIEYKIVITNIGKLTAYTPKIEDLIDNNLSSINVSSVSQGKGIVSNGVNQSLLTWSDITEISPTKSEELIYTAKVNTKSNVTITNSAMPNFSIIKGAKPIQGILSNEVFATVLQPVVTENFTFIPSKNNYISDMEALSYGVLGAEGKIGYIFKENGNNTSLYDLKIEPIPFDYYLVINNIFIEEIYKNTLYFENINDSLNLLSNDLNIIEIIYKIPENYIVINNPINFNVSIQAVSKGIPKTINNELSVGTVQLTTSYNIGEYPKNPSLFTIQYYIDINISKGIKVYDIELEAFYPPSCIFMNAESNGVSINVNQLRGKINYPFIDMIDATQQPVQLKYSYMVCQYKKTPLSIGELEKNKAVLGLRTARNIEDKYILNSSTLGLNEKLECVYVNKIIGKCIKYYKFENISIPEVTGYVFKDIVFNNPEIIQGSLSITNSGCDKDFSRIKYSFVIPYTIIYAQYNCSSIKTNEIQEKFKQQELEVIIYTPKNQGNLYSVLSEVVTNKVIINNIQTEFCACIGVVTSTISKEMVLMNTLGKSELVYCCPNCNSINN